jgi:type I restriction enzyme S subunit
VRLSDICIIGTGATPSTRNFTYYKDGTIPWIGSSETSNEYIDAPTTLITQKALDETNCTVYPIGTLIMAMYGEGKTRGQISELRISSATNQACAAIVPIFKEIKSFIKIYLKGNYLRLRTLAEGGMQPNLNLGKISSYMIPMPPLAEQIRIERVLNDLLLKVDLIDSEKSVIDVSLSHVKSKILELAISGKLVSQDPADEPAEEVLRRINSAAIPADKSHYQHLPKGWCESTLGKIGKWQSGGTPNKLNKEYYNGDIPWLLTADLNDGLITEIPKAISELGLQNSSAKLNPKGSVLIAMYGATIGKLGILNNPAATNQACCACVEYKGLNQKYLFYFLLSKREYFKSIGGGGAQPNISKDKITKTPIPIPPYNEQCRIVEAIENINRRIDDIAGAL